MKKKIALLLLLALAMTVILAACGGNTDPTKVIPRWDEKTSETYEYTISLSDFDLTADGSISSGHFKATSVGEEKYYRDFDVRLGEVFDSLDEVRPTSVTGKLVVTISHPDDKYDLLETKQEMELTYDNTSGKLIDSEVLAEMESKGLVVSDNGTAITLKSTTETSVEFRHEENKTGQNKIGQVPRRSSTKVVGFYIGKVHQEVSIYEISTEYDYQDKNTVVTSTLTKDGKTDKLENTLKRRLEGSFIDSNQLLTYARSLDKSSKSFQDNPSVTVYNPMTQTMQTVTFSFSPSANAILYDQTRNAQLFVKIPTIGVVVDGMPFMLQECAPNLKEKLPDLFDSQGNGPDTTYYAGFAYAKHTTLRFRVGYVSYELTGYETELWDALTALTKSK